MYLSICVVLMVIACMNVCLPVQSYNPDIENVVLVFGDGFIVYDNDEIFTVNKSTNVSPSDIVTVMFRMRYNPQRCSEYILYENDCKHFSRQILEYLESYEIECNLIIISFTCNNTLHMCNAVPLNDGSVLYIESTNHNTYYYFNDPYLFYNNVKEIYNVY